MAKVFDDLDLGFIYCNVCNEGGYSVEAIDGFEMVLSHSHVLGSWWKLAMAVSEVSCPFQLKIKSK